MRVLPVTGFAKIPDHPRSVSDYYKLGAQLVNGLMAGATPPAFFETDLTECWLWQAIQAHKNRTMKMIYHCAGDNAQKNTLDYHCVQHQKSSWVKQALTAFPETEVFVWLDFGILHQPNVTTAVICDFLSRVRNNDFALPGCWPKDWYREESPCWRFCGSSFVIPRKWVSDFDAAVKIVTKQRLYEKNLVTWEVNDYAEVERRFPNIPMRWYEGDHNERQFTNYI